jgi:hypothetical protein
LGAGVTGGGAGLIGEEQGEERGGRCGHF